MISTMLPSKETFFNSRHRHWEQKSPFVFNCSTLDWKFLYLVLFRRLVGLLVREVGSLHPTLREPRKMLMILVGFEPGVPLFEQLKFTAETERPL
jgi:hypothetical protein